MTLKSDSGSLAKVQNSEVGFGYDVGEGWVNMKNDVKVLRVAFMGFRGVSLVELFAVVGILAILGGIVASVVVG